MKDQPRLVQQNKVKRVTDDSVVQKEMQRREKGKRGEERGEREKRRGMRTEGERKR